MSNNRYANGRKLEYAAQRVLEAEGYWTLRSPGSKGAVDVLGLKMGRSLEILMVQCKLDGYLTPGERADLLAVADRFGAVALAASWRKDGRQARSVEFCQVASTGTGSVPWNPDYALELDSLPDPGQEPLF